MDLDRNKAKRLSSVNRSRKQFIFFDIPTSQYHTVGGFHIFLFFTYDISKQNTTHSI